MATPPRPSPVFLVAAPHSNAGVLRQMLGQHPDIAIASEFDFLVDAISADGRFMKRDAFLRTVEFNMGFRRLGLSIPASLPFTGIAQNLLDQVAASRPGAAAVGFSLRRHFDRILWLWPDARFIHLVRDGRDTAAADVAAKRNADLWHGIADWVHAETLWERMSHKLPIDRQFTLRYESLAVEPVHELQRLCDFLGVPYSPAMAEVRLPRDDAGRWKRFDQAEISAAEHRAARWLLQNGYFLSATVRPPTIFKRTGLNLRNRLAASNRRRQHLGTGLWLKSGYVKKFGSKKARARLRRQEADLIPVDEE